MEEKFEGIDAFDERLASLKPDDIISHGFIVKCKFTQSGWFNDLFELLKKDLEGITFKRKGIFKPEFHIEFKGTVKNYRFLLHVLGELNNQPL